MTLFSDLSIFFMFYQISNFFQDMSRRKQRNPKSLTSVGEEEGEGVKQEPPDQDEPEDVSNLVKVYLGRKFMNCSQSQNFSQ